MAAKLPKFTLSYSKRNGDWVLKKDKGAQVVKTFETKDDATKRGVLKKAVGKGGGSVKIQTQEGDYQEERTYPPSADPHSSKG